MLHEILSQQKEQNLGVLKKFLILCWATFIAIQGHRMDSPACIQMLAEGQAYLCVRACEE